MRKTIALLRREHASIERVLTVIEKSIESSKRVPALGRVLKYFGSLWNEHEKREDGLFRKMRNGLESETEKMLVHEHRELKGHWKVLELYMKRDEGSFRVALDTDGRMLVDKFRKHIEREEELFKKFD